MTTEIKNPENTEAYKVGSFPRSFGEWTHKEYDTEDGIDEWRNERLSVYIVKLSNGKYHALIANPDEETEFENVFEAADAVDELLSNV